MEKLYNNGKIRRAIMAVLTFLPILLLLFEYLVWGSASYTYRGNTEKVTLLNLYTSEFSTLTVAAIVFAVELIVTVILYVTTIKKNKIVNSIFVVNIITNIAQIILAAFYNKSSGYSTTYSYGGLYATLAIALVFNVIGVVYFILKAKFYTLPPEEEKSPVIEDEAKTPNQKVNRLVSFILAAVSTLLTSLVLFIPYISSEANNISYVVIKGIFNASTVDHLVISLIFGGIFIGAILFFSKVLESFLGWKKDYAKQSKLAVIINLLITLAFFLTGIIYTFVYTQMNSTTATSIGIIPFIIEAIIYVVHSLFNSKVIGEENEERAPKYKFKARWVVLAFVTIFVGLIFVQLALNFITVNNYTEMSATGYDLLLRVSNYDDGFTAVSYVLFGIVTIIGTLYVFVLGAAVANSNQLKRLGLTTIITSIAFVVIIGLFGKYYEICEKISYDSLIEQLTALFPSYASYFPSNDIKVTSTAYFIIFADVAVGIGLFIAKPFTKADLEIENAKIQLTSSEPLKVEAENNNNGGFGGNGSLSPEPTAANELMIDACPAFSELDEMVPEFESKLNERRAKLFANPSLSELTKFIVDYARESRLHLSYTNETIAQFIAGLGATKLQILQGMSGTGKTSLPKIFLEALCGNCEIVEVESSWKDKNELLGYYNEFSKTFTPKKFTRALYKATLNPDVITFIVLDEMNLSRIEYYFSDFLSLMENEPENRLIQLVNIKLYDNRTDEHKSYKGLIKDHTVLVPANVWFIGTANRDESTFEISDKVYDRAHTMNFNKRAPKVRNFAEPLSQRYLPYEMFQDLLDNAIKESTFSLDSVSYIKDVEEILRPYNISFGNRIMNQMENYVSIYSKCFASQEGVIDEAVEDILLSKVVSKLEFKAIEDKQELVSKFEKLNLMKCAEFIKGLNEDL